MAIPAIEDYRLADVGSQWPNIACWKPDPARAVLLVHDMQRFFLDFLPQSLRRELTGNCSVLVHRARQLGVPVVYTAQRGDMSVAERGLLREYWGAGMSAEDRHTGIVDLIAPKQGERVLHKWRYSAFFNTELAATIAAERRDQMVVCGVFAHIGILATAVDSFSRDIETFVCGDATADFSLSAHRMAMEYLARCCAVVLETGQVAT